MHLRAKECNEHGSDMMIGMNKTQLAATHNDEKSIYQFDKLSGIIDIHPKSNFPIVVFVLRITERCIGTVASDDTQDFISKTKEANGGNRPHVEVMPHTDKL